MHQWLQCAARSIARRACSFLLAHKESHSCFLPALAIWRDSKRHHNHPCHMPSGQNLFFPVAGIEKYLSGHGSLKQSHSQRVPNSQSAIALEGRTQFQDQWDDILRSRPSGQGSRKSNDYSAGLEAPRLPEPFRYGSGGLTAGHGPGPDRIGTEFPNFNQLPASERASLKTCLVLAAQQGMVNFTTLPRCPSWLLLPPPATGDVHRLAGVSGRSWQDLPPSQQLRGLESAQSLASQGSPMYGQALQASPQHADFGKQAYVPVSILPPDNDLSNSLLEDSNTHVSIVARIYNQLLEKRPKVIAFNVTVRLQDCQVEEAGDRILGHIRTCPPVRN